MRCCPAAQTLAIGIHLIAVVSALVSGIIGREYRLGKLTLGTISVLLLASAVVAAIRVAVI